MSTESVVMVVHGGRRLGLHSSLSRALRVLARYPVEATVVRVSDGEHLAVRVRNDFVFAFVSRDGKWGFTGGARAGVGAVPGFETVRSAGVIA